MTTVVKGKLLEQDKKHWDGVTRLASRKDATGGTIVGNSIGAYVDVLEAYGDSTNYTWQTVRDCTRRIGSTSVTLLFKPGTWVIDQDLTIASNFTSRIPAGCVFDVSSGNTLTFNGPVIRDSNIWTSGSGTVTGRGATPHNILDIRTPYYRSNTGLVASVASKALTIELKGENLTDPSVSNSVDITFRNATLTTGSYTKVSAVVATSVIVPSGATLGFAASGLGYVYVYAINNGGTVELAVSRKAIFAESGVHSTTAVSTGADSNSVLYSTTARTSVAVRLVGCVEITTGAVAGEWDNAPAVTHVVSESRSAEELFVSKNANLPVDIQIRNPNAGAAALAEFRADNGTGAGDFGIVGTSFNDGSNIAANEVFLIAESTAAGLHFRANGNVPIRLSVGIAGVVTECVRLGANTGALLVGTTVTTGAVIGNVVVPNNTNYMSVNAAGTGMVSLISAAVTNRTAIQCNSAILNFANSLTQAGTGAVVAYLRVQVNGVDRVIPVHAEA